MNISPLAFHSEIRKIANMRALVNARIFLLLSTFADTLLYFIDPSGIYSMYICFFSLLAPFFIEIAFYQHKSAKTSSILPSLEKEYSYNSIQYPCLLITFWLCNILLLVWFFRCYLTTKSTLNTIPFYILTGNILIYLFCFYYYQIKLHYQLRNNRW